MTKYRTGESQPPPYRSGRLFAADNQWFFDVRDGEPVGPYESREKAEWALAGYVAACLIMDETALERFLRERDATFRLGAMIEEAVGYEKVRLEQGLARAVCWLAHREDQVARSRGAFRHIQARLSMLRYLHTHSLWSDVVEVERTQVKKPSNEG